MPAKRENPTRRRATVRANAPLLTDDARQKFCAHLRLGGYADDAAALIGISEKKAMEWIGLGRIEKARRDDFEKRQAAGHALTPKEEREDQDQRKMMQRFVDFADAAFEAQSIGVASMLAVVTKAATGGIIKSVTTTTRTLKDGTVETTTVEDRVPADWRAAGWRLERRFPKKWGPRKEVMQTVGEADEDQSDEAYEAALSGLAKSLESLAMARTQGDARPPLQGRQNGSGSSPGDAE